MKGCMEDHKFGFSGFLIILGVILYLCSVGAIIGTICKNNCCKEKLK